MNIRLTKVVVILPRAREPLFAIPRLEIAAGTRLLVHGPSGRGKTTLLHLIAGLLLPSEGDVFVEENNLRFLSDEQRSRLRRRNFGIIFQRLNLIDHLTALENVQLAATNGSSRAGAIASLESLHLGSRLHERTGNLSLGEQQRVAVARVIFARPKILLADEPTSSLDAANAMAVMDALFAVPGNPTLVVVSHDARIRDRFSQTADFEEWKRV